MLFHFTVLVGNTVPRKIRMKILSIAPIRLKLGMPKYREMSRFLH